MNVRKTQVVRMTATAAATVIAFSLMNLVPISVTAQTPLYKSCQEDKLTEPLTLQQPATEAASAATMPATQAATAVANAPAGADDILFLSIVGSESQACYLASEIFLDNNMMKLKPGFNGPVGITQTISGDIALDRTNVANSQIGDITINISEFKSDNDRRDGFIRQRFLESNNFPFATLTGATPLGLPTGPYTEGATLQFKIKGTLTVHNTKRETVFNATGTYTAGALVVRAVTDLKMSEFGIEVPNIGGLVKVDDAMRLVINIVAREQKAPSTPAK